MAKLQIVLSADVDGRPEYAAPGNVDGVLSSKLIAPRDYSLWLCASRLRAGARMQWTADHGDEGVYLRSGRMEAAGREIQPGGGVVLEGGAVLVATAIEPVEVIHAGSWQPAGMNGGHVHIVGPGGWFASGADRSGVTARWLADSTCPTCRITLFWAGGAPGAGGDSAPHSHSQDEIIHILEGNLFLGGRKFEAGASLCIPADVRYKLSGGDEPFAYLNYRPDNATATRYTGPSAGKPEPGHAMARNGVAVLDVTHIPAA
jgi:hypothetical protein